MQVEAAGDDLGPSPEAIPQRVEGRQQAILGGGRWEADALCHYALATLADAVPVLDETGFLEQGRSSCGVGRQCIGSVGKITNCQIDVVAAYVPHHGHAFIDRALYLPKAGTDDPPRLAAIHVPASPPSASGRTHDRAHDHGRGAAHPSAAHGSRRCADGSARGRCMTADSIYGTSELEMLLRRAGKGCVLGVVNATRPCNAWIDKPEMASTAEQIAHELGPSTWWRLPAGEGTQGPRLYDWAYLELVDLEVEEVGAESPVLWTRGLLIRRTIGEQSPTFFTA